MSTIVLVRIFISVIVFYLDDENFRIFVVVVVMTKINLF